MPRRTGDPDGRDPGRRVEGQDRWRVPLQQGRQPNARRPLPLRGEIRASGPRLSSSRRRSRWSRAGRTLRGHEEAAADPDGRDGQGAVEDEVFDHPVVVRQADVHQRRCVRYPGDLPRSSDVIVTAQRTSFGSTSGRTTTRSGSTTSTRRRNAPASGPSSSGDRAAPPSRLFHCVSLHSGRRFI